MHAVYRPGLLLLSVLAAWIVLEFRGLFSPGLLDDVDSVYTECAREMLARHDFVTPYVDGVRFFDKPPLLYWLMAGSMRLFGVHDWAARLPLAVLTLGLFLAVYGLGARLFNKTAGGYAALITATCLGPYLFTRFLIPDVLLALWMTLGAHLYFEALDLLDEPLVDRRRLRWVCWGFAAMLAANVLTKGLIGVVFPVGLVLVHLAVGGRLRSLRKLSPYSSTLVFLLLAAPWHILAALRNPAVAGSPGARGWFWFYIVNEHVLRFFGKRIPHDYGQLPVPWFLLLGLFWLAPWICFLPGALAGVTARWRGAGRQRDALLLPLLWAGIVFGFFSMSSRQEYYSLPALPALALLLGFALSRAEEGDADAQRWALAASRWALLPVTVVLAAVSGYFAVTAPTPAKGADLVSVLVAHPEMYTLSMGHIGDFTGRAMGFFRGPLAALCAAMLVAGPVSHGLRARGKQTTANLALAAASVAVLLCVHAGLSRFYPIIGSEPLARAINGSLQTGDRVLLDGEYTLGSGLNFYTGRQVSVVDGRVNGLWYGSHWPDAPDIFVSNEGLHGLWSGSGRLFLLTPNATRAADLGRYGPVYALAAAGGKTVLTNRCDGPGCGR